MARNLKVFSAICFLILLTGLACSKSETPNPIPPAPVPDNSKNGGNLSRYEMITIPVAEALTQEFYIGNIAGKEVTLVRLDEKNLGFMADQNIPLGNQKLIVPVLKDFAYNFQISEKALTGTPEESIQPLLSVFNSVAQQHPENDEINKSLKSIVEVFNKASAEQKAIMARTYLANKPAIDTIINRLTINGNIQGLAKMSTTPVRTSNAFSLDRMGWMDNHHKIALISKHMTAILIMSVTGTGAVIIKPYGWHTVVLGGVSALAAVSAKKAVLEIAALTFYYTSFSLGIGPEYFQSTPYSDKRFMGLNTQNRTLNTSGAEALIFTSGKDRTVGAVVGARTIRENDKSGTSQTIKDFFTKLLDLQNYFTKINDAIKWVNENIPFSNIVLIDVPGIGSESKTGNVGVGKDALGKELTLSVQHPNIKVNKLSMSEPGILVVNLEVVNTQDKTISAEIKYDFADDFSKFSGVIPIKVEKELSLEGKWTMIEDRSGHLAGNEIVVSNTLCASVPAAKFTITGQVTFTKTSYSGVRNVQKFDYSGALLNPQTCELVRAGTFVPGHYNEPFSGTYTIENGKIASFTYVGIYYGGNIDLSVLSDDMISIDGNIYERNK